MKRITPGVLVAAVILSLVIGGIAGFVLGIASTRAGKAFIRGMVEAEKNAEVTHPQKLVREKFELEYPSNWKIDAEDKDYDPDHMFSIDSPGNAFVMFVIGSGDTDPRRQSPVHDRPV